MSQEPESRMSRRRAKRASGTRPSASDRGTTLFRGAQALPTGLWENMLKTVRGGKSLREARGTKIGLRARGALGPLLSAVVVAALATTTLVGALVPVDTTSPVRSQPLAAPRNQNLLVCPSAPGNVLDAVDLDTSREATVLTAEPGAQATYEDEPLEAGAPQELDSASGGVLVATRAGAAPAEAFGYTATLTEGGDLRGLSTAPCAAPSPVAWLVAGSARPGSHAELRLTNPGSTTVEATVTLYGPTGPVDLPAGGQVAVSPGETKAVALGGSGVDDRLAVQVVAVGGVLGAFLVDESLDGETPAGVEVVAPGAEPATQQVVPGVVLVEPDEQGQGAGESVSADESLVRVVNPSEEPATVSVTLLGKEAEQPLPGAEAVTVDPGAVFDLSLAGVAPGPYAVRVTSDLPVATAVQLVRSDGEYPQRSGALLHDRTWLQPQDVDLHEGASLSLPRQWGMSPSVVLTNSSDQVRKVTLQASDGSWTKEVVLPAGTTNMVTSTPEDLVELWGTATGEGVRAAVVSTLEVEGDTPGTLVSSLPAHPGIQAQSSRRVLVL